jgi:uncharacterized protein YceH (UPF0502 family)
MTDSVLNAVEVRVLGSLVEKQLTTPDYYPLTLNALTNACNQTSNRDPVVSLDEMVVVRGLDGLRDRKLAYLLDAAQSRVPRYGHKLADAWDLSAPDVAALCVLMLRGPQTVGEIRGRTGRMHEFATLAEAEATLEALAARPGRPLVAKLPRQAGFKEQRYAQLLGGEAPLEAAPAAAAPEAATLAVRAENERIARLEAEVEVLRQEMAGLKSELARFRQQFE